MVFADQRSRWGMVGSILLVSSVAMPSLAEEESKRSYSLEEVVVTARKIEESSQEVPVAITAITKELQQSSIRDITDLNGFAPNVAIDENGSRSNGAVINIRGISPTRSDDNSFDAPIAVMIDGVYLGSLAGQILENFDLERVEVLRGPQGTLFGKNTVGGVVNVIRSRPTDEAGARLKATFGQNKQQEFRAVVNTGFLIEDKLSAKLFMTTMRDDGYMDNITTGTRIPQKNYNNYGVTFQATPNDRFEARLTLEKYVDDSELNAYQTNYNFAPGIIAAPVDARETPLSLGSTNCALYPFSCRTSEDRPSTAEHDTLNAASLDTTAITLNASFELTDNLTLRSVTASRDMDEYRIYDFDGSAAPFITIERWNEFEQFSQEFRLEGQWDRATLIAGAYYWNSEFTQDWVTGGDFWAFLVDGPYGGFARTEEGYALCNQGVFGALRCDPGLSKIDGLVTQILYETQETTSTAIFAQMDYDLSDSLTLTAGLRWTEEEKHFIAGQAYISNVERQRERAFADYADLENKWTEVSPKVGFNYRISDSAIVYGSYSEGFHSGGFFGVNQNTADFVRDQYQPEYAHSTEIGLKSMWMDNRLRLNIAIFNNNFDDKQESFVTFDETTETVKSVFNNAGSAVYQGFELETEFQANEYLRLFLNYGSLDAEYKEFITDVDDDGVLDDASFLTPRNAPEYTLGVGFTLNAEVGSGDVELFAKYSTRGDYETDLRNLSAGRLSAGAGDDLSMALSYNLDRLSLTLFGKNMTDERFEVPTVLGGRPATNPSGAGAPLFVVGSVNRPRTYGFEIAYDM
jgi:iron complex outermembrane recepter protein